MFDLVFLLVLVLFVVLGFGCVVWLVFLLFFGVGYLGLRWVESWCFVSLLLVW